MIKIIIKRIKNGIAFYWNAITVNFYLKQWKGKKNDINRKIKVGFVVQMPEIWDKQAPVYEEMKKSENFDPYLIIAPSYNFEKDTLNPYGEEKQFFINSYPTDNIILSIDELGKPINIKSLNFDYIFLPRPYDHYLPKTLKSSSLVKHTKVCYIPYGYSGATTFNAGNTNKGFFRNIYISFCDTEDVKDGLKKNFRKNIEKGLQYFYCKGYPLFDTYLKMKTNSSSNGILWTPRWAFDPKLGGSHFLDYKDDFLALRDKFPNREIIIRPHPLMWENVVKEQRMSSEEVLQYKESLKENNIKIDSNKLMNVTIQDTDVLIADFSSIIINYFITGKPIIYCPFETELNEMYQALMPGIYVANNWEDIDKYLEMLHSGNDPLHDTREKIISEKLSHLSGGTQMVLNTLYEDYTN